MKIYMFTEIHDCMTPENKKFVENNDIQMLLGLTATLKAGIKYGKFTKKYLFDKLCPVVYELPVKESYKLGLHRPIKFYRFNVNLSGEKNLKCGSGKNTWYDSELNSYVYWTNRINKLKKDNFPFQQPGYVQELTQLYLQRKRILWNSPGKAQIYLQYIYHRLRGKTLVFANSLELLQKCQIQHILSGANKKTNEKYIHMFNDNEIDIIGSYKIVEQGENLEEFNNMVILSYDSKVDQFIQRIGRARLADSHINVIVISTNGTSETEVINDMLSKFKIQEIKEYQIDNV